MGGAGILGDFERADCDFCGELAHPLRLLGVQALVAMLIVALCRAEANVWSPTSMSPMEGFDATRSCRRTWTQRFWHFWRHWYPHLFFLFCFEELGALVHLVSPRWQDAKLIAFDHRLTGVHPVIWLEQFATAGRNEFMQFAYLTYLCICCCSAEFCITAKIGTGTGR